MANQMVVCSQGKSPVYEDISLALFSNEYLAVVSEEGPTIQRYMLVHLREMLEDVEVSRWRGSKRVSRGLASAPQASVDGIE